MDSNKKELFAKLKDNATKIKNALKHDELQLADLDNLLRERNAIFVELKDILVSGDINEKEEKLIAEMIEDNRFILDKMVEIKQNMESQFNKKEKDADKISKYSSQDLKG